MIENVLTSAMTFMLIAVGCFTIHEGFVLYMRPFIEHDLGFTIFACFLGGSMALVTGISICVCQIVTFLKKQ